MNRDGRDASKGRGIQSARERIYRGATASRDGRKALVSALLAVGVFLLVLSLSVRQSTDPAPAQRLIESGMAVTTDIDSVISENLEALQALARTSNAQVFAVPGYPLEVFLTREELLNQPPAKIRDLVLSRSSALVYIQGLRAFDRTGNQSLSRFSWQGLIEFGVSQLSASTNERAGTASVAFALLVAAAACAVLAVNAGWNRVRVLGVATLLGALPGVMLFALVWFGAAKIGESDPFVRDLREIARAVVAVPLRNYVVVSALGAILATSGVLLGRTAALLARDAGAAESAAGDFEDYLATDSPGPQGS